MRDTAQQTADRIREARRAAGTLGQLSPSLVAVLEVLDRHFPDVTSGRRIGAASELTALTNRQE